MPPTVRQTATWKTVTAVSRWSDTPRTQLTLLTPLAELRDNARDQLRADNNLAFKDQRGFPIDAEEWEPIQKEIKTIENLRDYNLKKVSNASTA